MDEQGQLNAADPAQAFEDLRAEVSVLRRAVEALPAAIRENRPPDYAQDLAVIGKGLDDIGAWIEAFQSYPALRMTPEQQGQAIANAGSALIRGAAQTLDRATLEVERERSHLAAMIGEARTQDRQFRDLCWIGGIALAAGLILSPFVAGLLPFGLNARVAALVMMQDQWDAGIALMKSGSPDGWAQLAADADLVSANRAKITACRNAAVKAKKQERCAIAVQAQ